MRTHRPEELFNAEVVRAVPESRRMSVGPHANGGESLRPLIPPDLLGQVTPVPKRSQPRPLVWPS
jgi:hypothetical protein